MRRNHDPGWAAVLSFFLPGLGQIYKGDFGKAIIMIPAWILCTVGVVRVYAERSLRSAFYLSSGNSDMWLFVLALAAIVILAWAVLGAYGDDTSSGRTADEVDPIERWEKMSEKERQRFLKSVEKDLELPDIKDNLNVPPPR